MQYNVYMNDTNTTQNDAKVFVLPTRNRNEYRCTRSMLYGKGSSGYNDLTSRNGHYILAYSAHEALLEMARRFPADGGNFTCQLWKENYI